MFLRPWLKCCVSAAVVMAILAINDPIAFLIGLLLADVVLFETFVERFWPTLRTQILPALSLFGGGLLLVGGQTATDEVHFLHPAPLMVANSLIATIRYRLIEFCYFPMHAFWILIAIGAALLLSIAAEIWRLNRYDLYLAQWSDLMSKAVNPAICAAMAVSISFAGASYLDDLAAGKDPITGVQREKSIYDALADGALDHANRRVDGSLICSNFEPDDLILFLGAERADVIIRRMVADGQHSQVLKRISTQHNVACETLS